MNKTKKNVFLKIAGLMAAVMMLATCVVAGTMAKYTSGGSTTGGLVDVAKWDIKVNSEPLDTTVELTSLDWNIAPIKTGTENNAVVADKIAPGTWGYAGIEVTNTGDVDALLKITNNPKPTSGADSTTLEFKVVAMSAAAGTSYEAMTTDVDGDLMSDGVKLAKTSGSFTIYICYKWTYSDGQDEEDTTMGKTGGQLTLNSITITATQVEPEKNT